jgi:hypothetical protein
MLYLALASQNTLLAVTQTRDRWLHGLLAILLLGLALGSAIAGPRLKNRASGQDHRFSGLTKLRRTLADREGRPA